MRFNHNVIIGIGAVIITFIVGSFLVLRSTEGDITRIQSQDGSVELRIPSGVNISGGKIEEIKINPLATERFSDIKSARVYELLPDGLTFDEPVTVVMKLPYDAEKQFTPLLATQSGDDASLLNIVHVEVDEVNNIASVTAELSHFSVLFADVEKHIF